MRTGRVFFCFFVCYIFCALAVPMGRANIAVIINNYEINPVQQGDLAQRLYAESLCRSGDIYYRRGMYPNAMEYYLKGMRVCDAGNIKDIQANLYKNIGNIYCSYNDFAMGSTYYDDAVRLALEIQDTTLLSRLYYNQAGAYCLGGNIGKAQEAYDKMVAVSDTGSPMDQYSLLMVKGIYPKSVIRLWVDCPLMSCSMLLA